MNTHIHFSLSLCVFIQSILIKFWSHVTGIKKIKYILPNC